METNGKSLDTEPRLTTSIEEMPTQVNSVLKEAIHTSSATATATLTLEPEPEPESEQINSSSGRDSNGIDGTTHNDDDDDSVDVDDDLPPHKLTIEVTSNSPLAGPEVEYEAEPPELTISVIESADGESLVDSSQEISSLDSSVEAVVVVEGQKQPEESKPNPKKPETRVTRATRNAFSKKEAERDEDEDEIEPMDTVSTETTKQNENGTTESSSSSAKNANPAPTTSTSTSGRKERKKRNTRSELDRLLMDEGTVKILMGPKARSGSPASKKEKMSELQKNRDMVINQVRDSSKTKLFNKVSLRLKSKNRRQQQKEQKDEKKAAEGPSSKIIRRRSSSSNFNFSSRSPSPLQMNAPLQSSAEDLVQVRIHDSVGYITIDAEAITFNTQTSSRLTSILNSLKLDEKVAVVQVSTTCDYFIQGLDIEAIRSETDDSLRESMADSMIACLDTLLKTLINYPKLLVAGVSGDAVDFGVLILGYFDLVYASDKATFQTSYGKNGYLPECLQLFPKNRLSHAMLYTGKKLTATEGLTSGLVTEVLWPAKFQEELACRIRATSSANQEVLLQTKLELNAKNSSKLELTRDLRSSWLRF